MKHKRLTTTDGFTLVELIVVITILAILGTIGFTSYVGTTRYARNSARAADLSTMRASLEIYQARWGQYPSPSYPEQVTYSGALVFTRGTFGPNTVAAVNSLSRKPVDPLHGVEYTYALLASGHQYELGAITEDGVLFSQAPSLIEHAHAAFDSVKAHVAGSYNGQVALAKLWDRTVVLALPSLTTSSTGSSDVSTIITGQQLVVHKQVSLPFTYSALDIPSNTAWPFTPGRIDVFAATGSLAQLTSALSTWTGQIALLRNLQAAYSGSLLSAWPEATALLSVDIDEDVAGARVFAEAIIKNRLELSIGTHLTAQSLITMAGSGTISGSAHWAWWDTIGYINFAPTVGPIVVTSAALAGHAWSPVTGWINLLPTLAGVTNTCDGQLGGNAWSEHRGFIDFSGVRIDGNGDFHGRATFSGSGAISFDGTAFATRTTWRPDCSDDTSLSFTSPINNATLLTRTPTISGANANFGARVYVTASNGAACNAAAGIGGMWSCTLSPALSPGQVVLSATMVALSGQATGTKTIQVIVP